MTKTVAIVGCGPAGLLAAHAVQLQGITPTIYSLKQKSPLGGAQYLHDPIPGLITPKKTIEYIKLGTAEGYAEKVYGHPKARCSWDQFPSGKIDAWSLYDLYEILWGRWVDKVTDLGVNGDTLSSLSQKNDAVVSTIPRSLLCMSDHTFWQQEISLRHHNGLPEGMSPDTIVYDGRPGELWYRHSCIFGDCWSEASNHHGEHVDNVMVGIKPLGHDCDCWEDVSNVIFAGRFGRWQKGILVHHAFDQVMKELGDALQ